MLFNQVDYFLEHLRIEKSASKLTLISYRLICCNSLIMLPRAANWQ